MRRIARSASFYPLTLTWLAGCGLAIAISAGRVRLGDGLAVLSFLALLLLQVSCRWELTAVRHRLDAQQDELVARVNQLVGALNAAQIVVPPELTAPTRISR